MAEPSAVDPSPHKPKLLDQPRELIRVMHYSIRTEQAYVDWCRRFILWHGKRHPREMGAKEVEAYLTHLAIERGVSASTQSQAKAALLFLYREVLEIELPWLDEIVEAKAARRLPVVLTPREVRIVLDELSGTMWLVASLLYGTGMRLLECLRLRVKDVDFERREIVIRVGKRNKDRVTVLPENLILPLRDQFARTRRTCPNRRWEGGDQPAGPALIRPRSSSRSVHTITGVTGLIRPYILCSDPAFASRYPNTV